MTNFLQVTSFDPLIVSEPQGPQGPQGQPGPVGPPGINGVASINGQTGVVDLSSNYVALGQLAAAPDQMASGTITRSATGAATSFAVAWPDGATGTYTGIESTAFPGAIDSYTVTRVKDGTTNTYTQPTLTRDTSGNVINRPAITVA